MFAMNSIKHDVDQNDEEKQSDTRNNNETKYEVILTKLEIERKIQLNDGNISVMFPGKTKSNVWNLFRIIVYKDIRQNFVTCLACNCVLAYKSRTGTASLLRHNCYKRMLTQYPSVHDFSLHDNNETFWNGPLLQNLIRQQTEQFTDNENTNIIIKCEPEDNYSTIYHNNNNDKDNNENNQRTAATDDFMCSTNGDMDMGEFSGGGTGGDIINAAAFLQQNSEHLTKFDLEEKLLCNDKDVRTEMPLKMKSDIWKKFKFIYYKEVKQNFVCCVGCSCILSYKKKTGSASLIRHRCQFKRKILPLRYSQTTTTTHKNNNDDGGGGSGSGNNEILLNETINSTKTMNHSLSNDTIINALSTYMSKFILPSTSALRPNFVPKERLTELAMNQIYFICKDLRPIDIFNNVKFREMMQALINIGADYGKQSIDNVLANGDLINSMLTKMCVEMKKKMKIILTTNDLSLTFDIWSREKETYLTVICNVITEDFEIRTLTLGTKSLNLINELSVQTQIINILGEYVDGPEIEIILAKCILVIDEKDGIISNTFKQNKKIICSCSKINKILENICNFENDVMEKDFKGIETLINFLKQSHIKFSFKSLTEIEYTNTWESRLELLNNYLESFDELLRSLHEISQFDLLINALNLKLFYDLLLPFKQCLDRLSSDERTTLNEVYLWKKKLEKHCQILDDDFEFIKQYKNELIKLLENIFDITDYHKVALFMDPKFKNLKFLTQTERESVIESVKTFIDQIIMEKKSDSLNKIDDSNNDDDDDGDGENKKDIIANDLFVEFMDCSVPDIEEDISKQEIKTYIDTRLNEPKTTLEFWKNENSCINLRLLVRSILNIPACSITNKLKFSDAGKLLKDRRASIKSRDRFLESSQQIEALVERFSRETSLPEAPLNQIGSGKIPLAYGKPGELKVWGILYLRLLASTFSCGWAGLKSLILRLLILPIAMLTLWILYSEVGDDQHGFFSKSGMILNILGLSYGTGILTTITLFPTWRRKFAQEYAEGLYSGATLLIAYDFVSLPFSFLSSALAALVIYPLILDPAEPSGYPYIYLLVSLWSSFVLAEQLCITFLLAIKNKINAAISVSYILCICLALASGTVRSFKGLAPWLQENIKGIHTRYASTLLHSATFSSRDMDCSPRNGIICPASADFLLERLGKADPQETTDIAASIAFAVGLAAFNMILYLFPTPRCIRRKFRD